MSVPRLCALWKEQRGLALPGNRAPHTGGSWGGALSGTSPHLPLSWSIRNTLKSHTTQGLTKPRAARSQWGSDRSMWGKLRNTRDPPTGPLPYHRLQLRPQGRTHRPRCQRQDHLSQQWAVASLMWPEELFSEKVVSPSEKDGHHLGAPDWNLLLSIKW